MSNFGTFVTEPIYCDDCAQALASVLAERSGPELYVNDGGVRWIAGKLRRLAATLLSIELDIELRDYIEEVICHPLRIVMLNDESDLELFTFTPSKAGGPNENDQT